MTTTDTVADTLCHFTYSKPKAIDLRQGDILLKNEELKGILTVVHPHYIEDEYNHFIILTQSCDLVRRDGKGCDAVYITLGAIRPLNWVLDYELRKYQTLLENIVGVCSKGKKAKLADFTRKLFNNNHTEYFYLHEDSALGFHESACALLRISIPLKAEECYEICLRARIISLTEVFQEKLGWLVGNIYSRVGTEDWDPKLVTEKISTLLEGLCEWCDDRVLRKANRTPPTEVSKENHEELLKHIKKTKVPTTRQIIEKNWRKYCGRRSLKKMRNQLSGLFLMTLKLLQV